MNSNDKHKQRANTKFMKSVESPKHIIFMRHQLGTNDARSTITPHTHTLKFKPKHTNKVVQSASRTENKRNLI